MTSINAKSTDTIAQQPSRPTGFRRAILRGLGVVLPPLLTIVVLIWAWTTIESYVLTPIETKLRQAIVWNVEQTLTEIPASAKPTVTTRPSDGFTYNGVRFLPDPTGRLYIPEHVRRTVDENLGYFGAFTAAPASADAYWHRYVQMTYLQRRYVVPVFLVVFTTVLYFLGKILTVGLGRWLIHRTEGAILQIPLINKVYGGVKQVTDLAFSEREIEISRVVAIQYPSEGIWSLGFVTSNSFRELVDVTGEPMLTLLMPTSPMPMTGFIVNVKRRDVVDMNITIDEAIQFIVSCGVVVPAHQRSDGAIDGAARTGTPVITTSPTIQIPNSPASK